MQIAEHHREQFELAYATAWAKDRNGDETPEQLAAEIKSWRIDDTYGEDLPRLRFGWEGYQWARAGQCLAQIEEPAAPAAVAPQGVVAWMTPEGDRVVTAETMDGARKDGGASLSSLRPYTVALVRAGEPAAAAPALEAPAAPGMAVTALVGEIVAALEADEKDGGYDLTSGLFGPNFSALVRRWAASEWAHVTAPQAPNCTRCSGSGEDPEGYLTHGHGPDDHTVDGPCRECDGTGAAPQAPAAPVGLPWRTGIPPWTDDRSVRVIAVTAHDDFGGVQVHDIRASDFHTDGDGDGAEVARVCTHWAYRDDIWPRADAVAPAAPIPWDNFPAYLIDHCEGQTITKEGLQRALAAMLANPQYAPAAPAAPAVDADPLGLRDVGEALMETIKSNADALKAVGWLGPMDCPSEIVVDLLNLLEEANTTSALGEWVATLEVDSEGGLDYETVPPCTLPAGCYPLYRAAQAKEGGEA